MWALPTEVKPETDHINLKVHGQDGAVVQFKIKRHTPLRKLITAYCERAGVRPEGVRFRFDGNPINENDTPNVVVTVNSRAAYLNITSGTGTGMELEMDDGDTIDVFQQQTGGRS
ncbi:Small ubiquitin- modifier 3 [Branchiostoma belcheri]|nr:Small ubiquitin- modifier 3 [Branchiostoma belcheri]